MAATRFWICGECGFPNSPHANRRTDEQNALCEQCGADSEELGTDVEPDKLMSIKRGA